MSLGFLGGIIQAGASLLGAKKQADTSAQNALLQQQYNKELMEMQRAENALGREQTDYWNERQLGFTDEWNNRQLQWAGTQFYEEKARKLHELRQRVYEANEAGVHPLFALGGSLGQGFSPVSVIPGQPNTGSFAAGGIGGGQAPQYEATDYGAAFNALGNVVSNYVNRDKIERRDQLEERRVEAAAKADEAQAHYWNSQAKRAQQQVNESGAARTIPLGSAWNLPAPRITGREAQQEANSRALEAAPGTAKLTLPFGIELETRRRTPAQAIEDWYGDVASAMIGVPAILEDIGSRIGTSLYDKTHQGR